MKEKTELWKNPPEEPGRTKYEFSDLEFETLYPQVLYTIRYQIGLRHQHSVVELYRYARKAFKISHEDHERILKMIAKEKPRIPVLHVTVNGARDLEPRGIYGAPNPYCMLGIQPVRNPIRQNINVGASTSSGSSSGSSGLRTLRRLGASLRRKDRSQKVELIDPIPAKQVETTKVKRATTTPSWCETFELDLEDTRTDRFHLDIWDHHDSTEPVTMTARKLNGLSRSSRHFKEITANASSDAIRNDFLGNVNIPVQMPGGHEIDRWFTLEGRGNCPKVQGKIHLKLSLGTRHSRGEEEGTENSHTLKEQEHLIYVFVQHELRKYQANPSRWTGVLPKYAKVIINAHAQLGGISRLENKICKWNAYFGKHLEVTLGYAVLLKLLEEVQEAWNRRQRDPSYFAERSLIESFDIFIERCFTLLYDHRTHFPALQFQSRMKLHFMLKCLQFLHNMEVFQNSRPFQLNLQTTIIDAVKQGTLRYVDGIRDARLPMNSRAEFLGYLETLNRDMKECLGKYQPIFARLLIFVVHMDIASVTYKEYSIRIFEEIIALAGRRVFREEGGILYFDTTENREEMNAFLQQFLNGEIVQFYIALLQFSKFKSCLSEEEQSRMAIRHFKEWFRDAISDWFFQVENKIKSRIYTAVRLDPDLYIQPLGLVLDLTDDLQQFQRRRVDPLFLFNVPETTYSVNDVKDYFKQLLMVWKALELPVEMTTIIYIRDIIEAISSGVVLYCNLLWKYLLSDRNNFDANGHILPTRKAILYTNNMQIMLGVLKYLLDDLKVPKIAAQLQLERNGFTADIWKERMSLPIVEASNHVQTMLQFFVKTIVHHMTPRIRSLVFHLVWGPIHIEPNKSIAPLSIYLKKTLISLRFAYLETTFLRISAEVYRTLLIEIKNLSLSNTQDQRPRFFHNIYVALNILAEYFHSKDVKLPIAIVHGELYQFIEKNIGHLLLDTDKLLGKYYTARSEETLKATNTDLGTLTVRLSYDSRRKILSTEILSASKLKPRDAYGLCDSYVIVKLVPKYMFNGRNEARTGRRSRTLNPVFKETFEWSLDIDEVENREATVNFVVMHHGYILKDSFQGEAYFPLYKVTEKTAESDEANTPKTIECHLTHPNCNSDAFIALRSRKWCAEANEFVSNERKKM
ncbi:Protein unc-13 like protein [Argiope bruennichi]|uniref:Protein unc-13 like protein n=1 Tax=Argiope bruennichi TaxID=94029 RepID=A0A8T0FP05_ARGBR|nr:Protein unc-13 like protein [Argiope bruennichi]